MIKIITTILLANVDGVEHLNQKTKFFLVMCRLRHVQGFHEQHLAFSFGILQSTASRFFISRINFIYPGIISLFHV